MLSQSSSALNYLSLFGVRSKEYRRLEKIVERVQFEFACLLLEFAHFDFYMHCLCFLDAFRVLEDRCFPLREFIQNPQQELVLVYPVSTQIILELASKWSLDRILLTLQETLQHHVNCKVDIIRPNVVSEVDFSFCLTHSEYRLNMTHSNRNATDLLTCASYFGVEGCNFLLVNLVKLGVYKPLGVHNVLLQELLVDLIVGVCLPNL